MQDTSFFDKINNVTLVIADVDGVLTDGGMYYSEGGDELKKFNVRDGVGVALLKAAGLKMGVISGENLVLITRRLEKMGVDFHYVGVRDKRTCVGEICARFNCSMQAIAYVGDEINDYSLLRNVGVFLTPADACVDLRSHADRVLNTRGGEGVLREVAELLLHQRGDYQEALQTYLRRLSEGAQSFQ